MNFEEYLKEEQYISESFNLEKIVKDMKSMEADDIINFFKGKVIIRKNMVDNVRTSFLQMMLSAGPGAYKSIDQAIDYFLSAYDVNKIQGNGLARKP